MKRIYDEPNPYGPEIKKIRHRVKEDDEKQIRRFKKHFVSLDAYERHKHMVNNYMLYYKGSTEQLKRDESKDKGVYDIIKENHRFLWGDEDLNEAAKDWDMQLAKKYYEKLYKEYCIADLSRFEKNQIGLRWRTEPEVISGKGQFECGGKHCFKTKKLTSWEVNFSYKEHGEHKNALVKVRLCPECSLKLNFYSKKKKIKKEKNKDKKKRKHKKRKRRHSDSEDSDVTVLSEDGPSTSRLSGLREVKEEKEEISAEMKRAAEKEKQEKDAEEIWSRPAPTADEEERPEDEMEQFFDDLLL